jgi:16S rRNA (uracil1498-N3)-methyltransferase
VFDGDGQEWEAEVLQIGRRDATVALRQPRPVAPALPLAITLALAVPANDRMDDLVEKATELGVARLQPLQTQHSVLRLDAARADKRRDHWQGVAAAAAEQCGRATVPVVGSWLTLPAWLAQLGHTPEAWRCVLDPQADQALAGERLAGPGAPTELLCLSGPEGGLSAAELALAAEHRFAARHLGPRVLRADTAPLAALAWLAVQLSDVTSGRAPPDARA